MKEGVGAKAHKQPLQARIELGAVSTEQAERYKSQPCRHLDIWSSHHQNGKRTN